MIEEEEEEYGYHNMVLFYRLGKIAFDFDNKINQFHHIHICINLKKSIQDIRNKKSITLLTPKLNLNLGLHSNLTQNSNKSDVN